MEMEMDIDGIHELQLAGWVESNLAWLIDLVAQLGAET